STLLKVAIPIPIPHVNPLQPPLGAVAPVPKKFELMKDTAILSPIAARVHVVARTAGTGYVVSATAARHGLALRRVVKACRRVRVRGVGTAFDGLSYVQSITSLLKRGEFKQRFTLTRNALVSITPKVPV